MVSTEMDWQTSLCYRFPNSQGQRITRTSIRSGLRGTYRRHLGVDQAKGEDWKVEHSAGVPFHQRF